MIVYIAGKMTGLEDKGRGAFREAEAYLKAQGFTVLTPAVLPVGLPKKAYMPICLAMLQQAEAIYLLDNWQDSPGAQLEMKYAKYQQKDIIFDGDTILRHMGDGIWRLDAWPREKDRT